MFLSCEIVCVLFQLFVLAICNSSHSAVVRHQSPVGQNWTTTGRQSARKQTRETSQEVRPQQLVRQSVSMDHVSVRTAKRLKTDPFAIDSNKQHLETASSNNEPALGLNSAPKRFKSSHKVSSNMFPSQQQNTSATISSQTLVASPFDSNNNNNTITSSHRSATRNFSADPTNDVNNNSIPISPPMQASNWRRDINSVNGTIDLSQYEQNDVDRLYGDALLVYFKNFNELSRQQQQQQQPWGA